MQDEIWLANLSLNVIVMLHLYNIGIRLHNNYLHLTLALTEIMNNMLSFLNTA